MSTPSLIPTPSSSPSPPCLSGTGSPALSENSESDTDNESDTFSGNSLLQRKEKSSVSTGKEVKADSVVSLPVPPFHAFVDMNSSWYVKLPSYSLPFIATKPTWVVIDGIVYDLGAFSSIHPGGPISLMLGGIDASLQYHSTHPFHSQREFLLLKPFALGKLDNGDNQSFDCWDTQNQKYDLQSPFAKDLIQSVRKQFSDPLSNKLRRLDATTAWYCRAAFYLCIWLFSEYYWVTTPSPWTAFRSGVCVLLVGLNIPHEANHWTVAHQQQQWRINDIFGWVMDLLGQSKYLWLQVHSFSHHLYVNDCACDHDVTSGEPFISFDLDESQRRTGQRPWFRWAGKSAWKRFVVVVFFLQFYRWTMMVDVTALTNLYKYRKEQDPATSADARRINRPTPWLLSQIPLTLIIRAVHVSWSYVPVFTLIVSAVYHLQFSVAACLLFSVYIRDATISLLLSLFFLVSHNFENSARSQSPTGSSSASGFKESGVRDWYREQVEASANYGGQFTIWLTGGLSYQIEHHLFPKINSAHLYEVGQVVKQVCDRHGVKYTCFPTLLHGWVSLFRHLLYIHEEPRVDSDAPHVAKAKSS